MLSLLMTILCSTSIALILKHNHTRKGNGLVLLMGNYFVAAVLSLLFLYMFTDIDYSLFSLLFGALLAFLFVYSFFAFTRAVGAAGTALATVSSRLSVVIPFLLSIVIFSETPGFWQINGFILALVTIILFYFSLRRLPAGQLQWSDYFYLFALLAGIGINDFSMKVFQQLRSESEKPFFLFSIFGFSFLYSAAMVYLKGIPVRRSTLLRGAVLGLPNLFSSYFLLGALASLPAIIVYPVTNIGIIIVTAGAAALLWKERPNIYGSIALVSGSIAIVLLSL